MKTSFDLESMLCELLLGSDIPGIISGSIYPGDSRPDDSDDEDIVINTIALTQDCLPQVATSNVNIYVKDVNKKINGKNQLKADRKRLKLLSERTMEVLRNAIFTGLKIIPGNQSLLAEPDIKQHYVNIRIDWNIQTI